MKGLTVNIYRSAEYPGRTRHNLFANVERLTLVGPEIDAVGGNVFAPSDDAPAAKLKIREIRGHKLISVEPLEIPEGSVGSMMGGAYVTTSDSRLSEAIARILEHDGFYGALALHDRVETAAEYNRYTS